MVGCSYIRISLIFFCFATCTNCYESDEEIKVLVLNTGNQSITDNYATIENIGKGKYFI